MTYFFPFIPYYGAIIVVFKVVNDNSPIFHKKMTKVQW